jgi:hypothetical protein
LEDFQDLSTVKMTMHDTEEGLWLAPNICFQEFPYVFIQRSSKVDRINV